jgi:hypothetical protein
MNKTLKLALGAVLPAAFVVSAYSQDNFPDVPDNHWAYEALARLKKDGLLVGYPDGLFRGSRPASRYELAVAIHATYVHLKSITDGLQAEIDQLKQQLNGVDIQSLKDAIAQLQDEVNGMKGWGADIDNLKQLADQFKKELASLGVDVEGLKKDLADLSKRVGVLEAHRLPFDIHGDASFYLIGGNSSGGNIGITVDGRPVGARVYTGTTGSTLTTGYALKPVGIDQDSTIYHELTLKLTSNNDTGPKWHGDVVIGDMLGNYSESASSISGSGFVGGVFGEPFASQSRPTTGLPFSVATESVYVQDLAVDFDTSVAGQGLAAELGRTGYEIDPYIYQRPDPLPYFTNDRWGDGKWYFDGGILGFHWGGVRFDVFGGKQNQATATDADPYQVMGVGAVGHPFVPGSGPRPVGLNNDTSAYALYAESELGGNLSVPIGQNGKIDAAYVLFGGNVAANSISDRADTYGATLKYNFNSVKLNAGYAASDLYDGGHNITPSHNYAWHASLAWDPGRYGIEAGYRQIEPQFGAPGDWGRIGIWWNPTDIQGPWVSAHVKLTDQLSLKASGEWYQGTNTSFNLYNGTGSTGLSNNDTVADYKAELGFKLNEAWDFTAGFEYVDWHMADRTGSGGPAGANPYESWYNFGLGYNLSDQARLSLMYQYSAYDGRGYAGGQFTPFAGILGGQTDKLMGSLITTQLTVKF